jgi:hypothetical protein
MKQLFTIGFLILAISIQAQESKNIITKFLKESSTKKNDATSWKIADETKDKYSGITHVYLQQYFNNVPLYKAISIVAIKNNAVVYFKNGFIQNVEAKINSTKNTVQAPEAINYMLQDLAISTKKPFEKISEEKNKYQFVNSDVAHGKILVVLVYQLKANQLLLAWNVSMDLKHKANYWNYRIDANTGKVLDRNDYTAHCDFSPSEACPPPPPPPPPLPATSYRVFGLPIEAPSFGARTLLMSPEDSTASPFTWQDDDGIAGAEHTITRGNNVYVYEDSNDVDVPGYSPTALPVLQFDYPYSAATPPSNNVDAGLTNLFYMNNILHDKLHTLGFDEDAGNFQHNNYGNNGANDDEVIAEGFDGGGSNNANMSTPPDGFNPRMQMYIWTGSSVGCSALSVNAPGYLVGNVPFGTGPFLSNVTITDTVILANDGIVPTADACSPIINNIAGKIVLIDRGSCTFLSKVTAAQNAGAVGVLIANNTGGIITMGGAGTGITIPVLSISQADGILIKNALTNNVTVTATLNTCIAAPLDGDLDNGVIAHEYGHGVSNRLTGGPAQSGCLSNQEQAGEGWSDWLALISTIEPGDAANDARGIGTYLKSEPTTGAGIRRFPYSYDLAINSQSYGDLAANNEVHAIGEIWCSALWDMTWLLINAYGYNANTHDSTAGNNIAMRLVLEGMKLQPCDPGFLDSRDAILMADSLLYNNAHKCIIWQAFARRGMGINAVQGDNYTAGDEVEDFTIPAVAPAAIVTPSNGTICAGNAITLAGAGSGTFTWSGGVTNNIAFTPTTSGIYTLTSTGACAGTTTVSVTVNPKPNITISVAPSSTVCAGDSIQLNATNTGSTTTSIVWNPTATNNVLFPINNNTTYSVTLTNTLGCSNTATQAITVNPIISTAATVNISANQTSTSVGLPVTYYAQILPSAITNYQLQWYVDGVLSATTNTPIDSFTHTSTDKKINVYCVMKVLTNCITPNTATSNSISVNNATSISTVQANNELFIFPNPARDILHVEIKNKNMRISQVKIVDALGKVIIENKNVNYAAKQLNNINIEALANGLYYFQAMDEKNNLYTLSFSKY